MSNYIYYNGELYHYGIPGMKWGKRKAVYEKQANDYRTASQFVVGKRKEYYLKKADKLTAKAESLTTTKGRVIETAKDVTKTAVGVGAAVLAASVMVKYLKQPFRQFNVNNRFKNEVAKGAVRGTLDRIGQVSLKGLSGDKNLTNTALKLATKIGR